MYVKNVTAQQEGPAQNGLCTIRVEWELGDQEPDLIEVYVAPITAERAGRAPVSPDARVYRTKVPAGNFYRVYVCPRLVDDANNPEQKMPDGFGGMHYWDSFCQELVVLAKAEPQPLPSPSDLPVPRITSAGPVRPASGITEIQVFWESQKPYGFYQIRWAEKGRPEVKVRLAPGARSFDLSPVFSPVIYTFRIQGCNSNVLGFSGCSAWSEPAEVYVEPGWGAQAAPVAALTAAATGRTSVRLSWQNPQPYDAIRIERRADWEPDWNYAAPTVSVDLPGGTTSHDDDGLFPNTIYQYRVTGLRGRYEPCPTGVEATTRPQPASSALVATRAWRNSFVLAVRSPDERVLFYSRHNGVEGLPWGRSSAVDALFGPVDSNPNSSHAPIRLYPVSVGLLESNLARAGSLELVARVRSPMSGSSGDRLLHFYRNLLATSDPWQGGNRIAVNGQPIEGVTGRPAFIQSYWGQRGNFELVVPQGKRLAHYWRNNDDPNLPWNQAPDIIAPAAVNTGDDMSAPLAALPVSAALLQSNFNRPGNLELIVRMRPALPLGGGDYLSHFYFDSSTMRWVGPFPIVVEGERISGVTGDPAFIQSTRGRQGHFELVVPLGNQLVHYWRDNDDPAFPWRKQADVISPAQGPVTGDSAPIPARPVAVSLVQSIFGWPGNLELIVQIQQAIPLAGGDLLNHYWFDSASAQWHGPYPVTENGRQVLALAEE